MKNDSLARQLAGLFGWLVLVFAVAAIGGVASANAGSFYADLNRPSWAPPAWLFGPVWSLLYLLMGVAAWLVWRTERSPAVRLALVLFLCQLVANGLWSWLFFAWQKGALAFAEILLVWALVLATLILFWRIRPLAGMLLVPYLAWVTFATALAYQTWQLNPVLLG